MDLPKRLTRPAARRLPPFALVAALVLLPGCEPKLTAPTLPEKPPVLQTGDWPIAWTPDGQSILFRRINNTTLGPPGVYLMRLDDPKPRWLMPAGILWPTTASFSPDGKRVVMSYALTLRIVDLETGAITMPFYTARGADFPVWLKDGRILYARVFGIRDQPDSNGVHIFDPVSRQDVPVGFEGQPLTGSHVSTSPFTGEIAMRATGPVNARVLIGTPDASSFREVSPPRAYRAPLGTQWSFNPLTGDHQLYVLRNPDPTQPDLSGGTMAYSLDTRSFRPFPEVAPPFDRVSPDGRVVLMQRTDPATRVVVLYVKKLDNPLGLPPKQVTYWGPWPASVR